MNPLDRDIAAVRERFPGLATDWVTFDSAGGSQILGACIDAIADYLRTTNVQLGASYAMSEAAAVRVGAGRAAAADLLGAEVADVALGASSTELLSRLALALGGPGARGIRPGDEIIVTDVDHEANIGPWRRLASLGITIRTWPVNTESWLLELDDLAPLMRDRTRLVCFTHASNVLGAIHPVADYASFIHARDAMVCVDGVAYAPHGRVDVGAWDVDFYVTSLYKVFGPHVASLFVRRDRQALLASQNHDFIGPSFPAMLEPGNVNYEAVASLVAIPDYVGGLDRGWGAIVRRETALQARFLAGLVAIPGVSVIGPPEPDRERRVSTVSFVVDGVSSDRVPRRLEQERIAVRHGHFYAKRLIDRLGLDTVGGVVRASFLHYHTEAEVDRAVAAIERAIAAERGQSTSASRPNTSG